MSNRDSFCHPRHMQDASQLRFNRRMVDSLYTEAMLLADEARSYFDDYGRLERDGLSPADRVAFSCESIKVTTRLMHVIAWLLTQKAVEAGELTALDARDPARRLGEPVATSVHSMAAMPASARALIRASIDIHDRIAALDVAAAEPDESPARKLMDRLAQAF